ncbi:MAG: hypothetical protein ACM3MF_05890 [Anaerolineae bacterium]
MGTKESDGLPGLVVQVELKKLTREQVRQIDEALLSLDEYGEVRLIVQHGQLRYINRVESHRAWDTRLRHDDSS